MDHLGGAIEGDMYTYMSDVWGYLSIKYGLKSVIDVGCGFGHALKWFAEYGFQVLGVDGWREAVQKSQVPGMVMEHDFNNGIPLINQSFDLAWSAEFLEHVDERYLVNVMPVFQKARYSVITHGLPGQEGYHHVNCQTDDYWTNKFAEYGMKLDSEQTALLRSTDRGALYGRRTLMLFTNELFGQAVESAWQHQRTPDFIPVDFPAK